MIVRWIIALVSVLIINLSLVIGALGLGPAMPSSGQVSFMRFEPDHSWRLYLYDLAYQLTLPLFSLPGFSFVTGQNQVLWSPDGEAVAYMRYLQGMQSELVVQPMDGPARVFPVSGLLQFYHWSPDGASLVYSRVIDTVSSIHHLNLATGRTTRIEAPAGFAPVWSSDGREIYYLQQDQPRVIVYDAVSGDSRLLWDYGESVTPSHQILVSPQGRYLALSIFASVWLYDLSTGDTRHIGGETTDITDPAWSPDGESMILAQRVGPAPAALWRYDAAGDQREWIAVGTNPAWDTRHGLLYVSPAGGLMHRDMTSGESRRLSRIANAAFPAWRPGR